ncbi:multiple resistance and pH regulation protein F [Starkeya koreensis]|uniref:Multiple resistance and pH regulation protein F n=1 Tax=Ancylobacter koreensis TaxID=266121 RepID=A0ABT0DQY6_9HYPH|nr:multiple resistance and pH regulation protein F [Ancylobacter koreensis]MCK0209697.1 multiple resistance and pH regulation protein F [Ancylobacter koreensis]
MAEFLLFAALLVALMVLASLAALLRAPARAGGADRLMIVQLAGTGGTAIALLLAGALDIASLTDVALTLAVLAAFASAALHAAGVAEEKR